PGRGSRRTHARRSATRPLLPHHPPRTDRPGARARAAGGAGGRGRRPRPRAAAGTRVSAADRTPRAFAALLRVYPRDARARFGDAMRYAWQQDLDRARAAGTLALAAFWIATTADALRFGIAERIPRVSLRPALTVDWRDASRAVCAAPLVSTFAVLSLALGIGGVTALFSILNSITLKPLPVRDPGRVVLLDGSWTNPIWEAIRDRQAGIADGAFAWATDRLNL